MKHLLLFVAALFFHCVAFSQSKAAIEVLAQKPKTVKQFPVDYKIALPTPTEASWDKDFESYYKYLNPALTKTQMSLSYTDKGIQTRVCQNSVSPHAQLDTSTIIRDKTKLEGTWRMVTYRKIRFIDSMSAMHADLFRSDTLLADNSADDAFAVFSSDQFRLYAKESGNRRFHVKGTAKYSLENGRYALFYKLFKSGASIAQTGIDENGYLMLNYPAVIESVLPQKYIIHTAVIEQFIFERVN